MSRSAGKSAFENSVVVVEVVLIPLAVVVVVVDVVTGSGTPT